jgi:alpha-2-macroglobulin
MKTPKLFWTRLALMVAVASLTLVACKRKISVKSMTKSMAAYIYAYSSGTLSRDQPVRVRFTAPLIQLEEVGKAVDNGVFSMNPAVKGQAVWEDAQTLKFTPEDSYTGNQTYVASVNLKRIFKNVPKDAEEFQFDFRTRELYFEVHPDGIQPENGSDPTVVELAGELKTSDKADNKAVEQLMTAKQASRALKMSWTHAADGIKHTFKAKGIKRGKEQTKVQLAWSGKPLGVDYRDETWVTIPAVGEFMAMNARLVQDAEQYIKVNFSDPLSITQDLKGILKLNDFYGNLRFAIDGNAVLIYPQDRVSGERDLYVMNGVKNTQNKDLTQPMTFKLAFSDVRPEVRLVGRGVILPNSNGLNFPFEAINLNYVDVEVVKVFNNNILQFLQTNDLDGNNDLERVGNIVMQKRVSLKDLNPNASTSHRTRYGIDLSDLVKKDPTAIYQVRVGFRRSYTNYSCNADGETNDLKGMTLAKNDDFKQGEASYGGDNEDGEIGGDRWENQQSIMRYNWNGGEGFSNSNGRDDENPCSASYYNQDHFVKRNVFCSDLGIIAKKGNDNSIFIAVSNLKTTNPRSGVKLEFFDYQNQSIGKAVTGADGTTVVKDMKGKPWVVVASADNEKGYLPLSSNNALSMSRFDVAGGVSQKGLKGYVYGERGVWRPGDTVHLNFILEDKNNQLPDDFPVTLEMSDPKGTLQYRTTTFENVKDIYPFKIPTRDDAPTGAWSVTVKAGGATFHENIKIETVKPNRLKINIDFGKKEFAVDEPLTGNMQVNWLHGAPARGVKVRIESNLRYVETTFPKFKDYIFEDPMKSFSSDPTVLFDGNVDDNGAGKVTANVAKPDNAKGKMQLGLKIRAFEPSGDFSSDYQTLTYFPFKSYVGIHIPKNRNEEKRFEKDKNGQIQVAIVDKNGNPLRNQSVNVDIYRLEWRWWWETGSDDESQFTSGENLKTIITKQVTTNGSGLANIDVKLSEWGRYFVRAVEPNGGHVAGDYFYIGYPWDDGDNGDMSRNNVTMLNFKPTKEKYNVGETVEINIPTPEAGRALVSIENGTKVIESQWITTKSGMTKHTFKATADMAPTVYAFVTLIQPHNTDKNDLPIRMYGVTPINVEDPATKLEPIVKTPAVLKPEETAIVEVREKHNKPMAYTIALVDEGLLDLTRFQTPNPWNAFYTREALGVQTFDVYDQVLGAYGGNLERILNIGGDAAKKPKNAQTANRFKPVVMTLGPFFSDGRNTRHEIKVPNYVGSVRAMVVAAYKGSYGSGEATVPVRKPLMVIATLPRVLTQKETVKLPVNVFAMEAKIKNVNIKVIEKSGLVQVLGSNTRSVTFDKPSDKMVDFELAVSEGSGIAKFQIVAEGGGERATTDIEIDVRNPNPMITDIKNGYLQAGQSMSFDYNALGAKGTNKATLEVSTIPPIDLGARLQYLLKYPYGCVEQTTSTVFPQLYVDKLMQLDDNGKKLTANNIRAGLERLKQFQTASGGFGYWPGDNVADAWASNYVGHFLVEAKNVGYSLPTNMLENLVKAQQTAAKRWVATGIMDGWSGESHDLNQAYRLYFLAAAKAPESASMNALREKKDLKGTARWALASAYALAGKPEIAKQLIKNVPLTVPKYREWSYTFGSELRDQAMMLETMVLLKDYTQAMSLAKDVSQKLSSGDWYATQSVAWGLLSMSKLASGNKMGEAFTFNYDIGGKAGNFTSKTPVALIDIPADGPNKLMVKNPNKNPLFVRLILRGQPSVMQPLEKPIASNLNMNIQYKTLKGEALNPAFLRQGTDFIAEVTITNPNALGKQYKEMALSQIFPSGWEIHNARMDNVSGYTNTSIPRYQDIRDDRVNTFFNIEAGKSHTYRVQLTAAYVGKFYLPNQLCEAMYDNSISARASGGWVEVSVGERKVM